MKFYLISSSVIIILTKLIINLSLFYLLLTFNQKFAIMIGVTWFIKELAEYNLAMTLKNMEKNNGKNSKIP